MNWFNLTKYRRVQCKIILWSFVFFKTLLNHKIFSVTYYRKQFYKCTFLLYTSFQCILNWKHVSDSNILKCISSHTSNWKPVYAIPACLCRLLWAVDCCSNWSWEWKRLWGIMFFSGSSRSGNGLHSEGIYGVATYRNLQWSLIKRLTM